MIDWDLLTEIAIIAFCVTLVGVIIITVYENIGGH